MELADYKVRVLSGEFGTGAKVRVLVESKDGTDSWGVATCGPGISIRSGAQVSAGAMISSSEEV